MQVVALPCWSVFQHQDQAYRDSVLPPQITARVAVEAASTFGWERWTGMTGTILGIDHFGFSGPCQDVYEACGLTTEAVVNAVLGQLSRKKRND